MNTRTIIAFLVLTVAAAFAPVARAETLRDAVDSYLKAAEGDPAEERWKISGNLGATVTSGNSDTQTFTVGMDAERPWAPWSLFLKWRSVYGKADGLENANEHILTERLERQLNEKAWLFQEFMIEHDEREELDYRLQLTLGYKRLLIKKEKLELTGEAGGGVMHEEFRTGPETEAIAQLGLALKWQITKALLFTQLLTFYPSISDGGEFRLVSESVFTTPLGEKLDLRFSIIDRFDSNPPMGVKDNDLLVGLSLAVRFT